jgi:hypothetical protein
MKVKDKELKKDVDVRCKDCPGYECYWPRPHPGVFNQGVGYTQTAAMQKKYGYICGNREIRGCPENPRVRL